MSLAALLTQTVVIQRYTVTGRDSLGNDTTTWTTVGTTTGMVQSLARSQSGDELLDARDTVIERWTLYLPAGTDIRARDRVTVDSVAYEVDGPTDATTVSPLTGIGYVSAVLRRITDG